MVYPPPPYVPPLSSQPGVSLVNAPTSTPEIPSLPQQPGPFSNGNVIPTAPVDPSFQPGNISQLVRSINTIMPSQAAPILEKKMIKVPWIEMILAGLILYFFVLESEV